MMGWWMMWRSSRWLPSGRGGQFLTGAQQDPQGLAVAVGAGSGQFVGVETEGVEHYQGSSIIPSISRKLSGNR
jgi:hypothetical protein